MKALLLSLICLNCIYADNLNWDRMSKTEQHELLLNIDYTPQEELPRGTETLDLTQEISNHPEFKKFYEAAQIKLEEVDRESIEQSPYSSYGPEEIVHFIVLVRKNKILGAQIYMYQDGRDEEGEDSDVNWSAHISLDADVEFFTDENGDVLDDLRFEWSGH